MSNFDSKSLLAKLMATENLYVLEAKVPTASFDVLNRVLTIPILDDKLSGDLYDLFIGHEVGHALYTPVDKMKAAKDAGVHMSILNVVEDCRIERKVKYKYPGLKNCFVKAYDELYKKDFFETEGKDLQELNFVDRMNLHHKIGPILGIKFTDFERELVRDVESCETYDECVIMAKKIAEYMKEELEKQQEEKEKIRVAVLVDGDEETEGLFQADSGESLEDFDVVIDARGQNSAEEDKKSEKTNDGSESGAKGAAGEDGETEETDKVAENSTNKPSSGLEGTMGNRGQAIEEQIKSFTDEAYNRNQERLYSTDIKNIVYASVPKFDTDRIYDYKKLYADYVAERGTLNFKHYMKFKKESNKVVSYLVKEFELRKNASQLKRASTAKTGELNMNKIYSYNFNEDIFKKISVMPDGKSHGLIMYLDWSGSMVNHIGNTMKQLLNLALFCRKVNIPFEVYSFIEETKEEYMCQFNLQAGDLSTYKFGLLNILSSRMNNKDFTIAATSLMDISGIGAYSRAGIAPTWMRMSGTPLNEAIMSAMEIVPEFQKKNRLQIVNTVFLTDGEGHYLSNVYQERFGYTSTSLNSRKNEYVVLRDKKTRREERYNFGSGSSSLQQSNALIRLLKHRTGSHVIGFYVTNTSEFKNRIRFFYDVRVEKEGSTLIDYDKVETIKQQFIKNKYAISTMTGFDDYYILRSNGLDTEDDAELEIKENATTRGIVSAFTKYAGNRVNNRVILNRFISWIS
jgi:hypothetical protein